MLQKQLQNSYEANKQAEQKARQLEIDVIKTNIICDEDNELIIAKGLAKLNEKYSMIFKYSWKQSEANSLCFMSEGQIRFDHDFYEL